MKKKLDGTLPDQTSHDYFRIGGAVDTLLTEPDKFDERYEIVAAFRPSGFMGSFIDNLPKDLTPDAPKETYSYAYYKSGYSIPIERAISSFWSKIDNVNYYNYIRNRPDKKVSLTPEDHRVILRCIEAIKDANLLEYFNPTDIHTESMMQFKYEFPYRGFNCKVMLDGVLIDHNNHTIKGFDLKTTSKSVTDFKSAFITNGYYRQAGLYVLALQHAFEDLIKNHGYKLLPFEFLVVTKRIDSYTPAVVYTLDWNTTLIGLHGATINGVKYTGIDEQVDDLQFYLDNNEWRWPREIAESEGKLKLSLYE